MGKVVDQKYVIVRLDADLHPIDVLAHDSIVVPARRALEAGEISVDASPEFWHRWLGTYLVFGTRVESEAS